MVRFNYTKEMDIKPGETVYDIQKNVLCFADEEGNIKSSREVVEVDKLFEYNPFKKIKGYPFEELEYYYFEKSSGRFYVYFDGKFIAVCEKATD